MERLTVTPSPHIRIPTKTSMVMRDVIIALCPALIASSYIFGYRALIVTLICVIGCVGFEYLSRYFMKRKQTVSDLSAVVTGILLAFNLPVTIPIWIALIGSFFAIVIVKQLFGGIGQNFANPALTARVVLLVSFASQMTTWVNPGNIDTVASATPLLNIQDTGRLALFLGTTPGCIGETSSAALLLGGAYLVFRRVIAPTIPVVYITSVFLFSWLFGSDPVNQIFAGGLMLGAIFMATDYATSPLTTKGKVIFAFGCGLITIAIRLYGNYPDGVSFSILFMNILVPLIDRWTLPIPFGRKKIKGLRETEEKTSKKKRNYRFLIAPTVMLASISAFIALVLVITYQSTGVGNIEPGLTQQQLKDYSFLIQTDELIQRKAAITNENFVGVYTDAAQQGVAIQVKTVGYAGKSNPIEILVGFDKAGVITGVVVVSSSETPGLGTRIQDPAYLNNFIGLSESTDAIDTITGATISSRALKVGVEEAFLIFEQVKEQVLS